MPPLISTKKIKPSGPEGSPILVVGEFPNYDDDVNGIPFSPTGDVGDLLNNSLGRINLSREDVRITNVCNYRPANNKFDYLLNSPQLAEGVKEVHEYIKQYKNQIKFVILLGAKPLEYIGRKYGIENWSGSVIQLEGINYFANYHPSYIVRNRPLFPIYSEYFRKLERYIREGYKKPYHNYTIDPKGFELEECLREIEASNIITVDLEGVKRSFHILCCGFGLSKSRAICLPNHSFAKGELEFTFKNNLIRILENPQIEKIFQNGFGYDIEVLRDHGINVANYGFDTMIAAHVLEPEMPYKLSFLTSMFTDEPYYKDKGKSSIPDDDDKEWNEEFDKNVLYDYNCTDVITDFEIAEKQKIELNENKFWDTYKYKHSLIPLSQHISRTGTLIDIERREELKIEITKKAIYYQSALNTIAEFKINPKSGPACKKLLVDKFGLPEKKNREGGITFDEDAIVSYINTCQSKIEEYKTQVKKDEWKFKLFACKLILLVRGYRHILSNYINIDISADGRLRSSYNLSAGTETGRASCHKWIDSTGLNAQTWPREILEIIENEPN